MSDVKVEFSGKLQGIKNVGIHDGGGYAVAKFEDNTNSGQISILDFTAEEQAGFKLWYSALAIKAMESREEGVTDGVVTVSDVATAIDEKIAEKQAVVDAEEIEETIKEIEK